MWLRHRTHGRRRWKGFFPLCIQHGDELRRFLNSVQEQSPFWVSLLLPASPKSLEGPPNAIPFPCAWSHDSRCRLSTCEDTISPAHRTIPLTVHEIRSVALELVRNEGLAALSMRRLASALGVTPGSLYYHVGDKSELLHLVLDAVLETLELPPNDLEWRGWIEGLVAALTSTFREYPGVIEHLQTEGNPNLSAWQLTDRVFGVLLDAGFDREETGTVFIALMTLVGGRVLAEQRGPDRPPHAPGHDAFVEMFARHADELSNVAAILPALVAQPPSAVTDDVVRLLLDGAQAQRERPRREP